jgi:hypothetical protein
MKPRRVPGTGATALQRRRSAKIDIRIPRDREGTFDPKLIQRYQRRFPGFDDKIVSMYARGMTVREIQGHLLELYGLEVSPENRPLETRYPLVFFDAIGAKIRDEGLVDRTGQSNARAVGLECIWRSTTTRASPIRKSCPTACDRADRMAAIRLVARYAGNSISTIRR